MKRIDTSRVDQLVGRDDCWAVSVLYDVRRVRVYLHWVALVILVSAIVGAVALSRWG